MYESFAAHCPEMEELAELLESGEVRAVFSGHTHFVSCSGRNGVLYSTAASTAFSMEMRRADRGMVFSDRSTFNLVRVGEDEMCIRDRLPCPSHAASVRHAAPSIRCLLYTSRCV